MRGIIFTEFMEMVESSFGYELLDEVIASANLPSNGVYTSVGNYPHPEMVSLVVNLSEKTKIPVDQLLETFGGHMHQVFSKNYGHFFKHADNSFGFLESIEDYIHVEVKKLYPDAELPSFKTERLSDSIFQMIYTSERSMASLAKGLIQATIEYYDETIDLEMKLLDELGSIAQFTSHKK